MSFNSTSICSLVILLLIPFVCFSQEEVDESTRAKIINTAKEIMNDAQTSALITLDQNGNARVRTMDPFSPEENLTVWFGTNSHSRKVEQIRENNQVTLYYLDKRATGYVTIHGTAELVDDNSLKKKYWKEAWKNFYPNYPEGYLLIKVSPKWMEVISETRGVLGDDKTWQPQKIIFN